MIKINLLETSAGPQGQHVEQKSTGARHVVFIVVLHFVLLTFFSGGLYYYDTLLLGRANAKLNLTKNKLTKLTGTKKKLDKEYEEVKGVQKEYKNLGHKIDFFVSHISMRSAFLKGLTSISASKTANIWFAGLKYQKYKFFIEGHADETGDLDVFIENLKKRAFFKHVLLDKNLEAQAGGRAQNKQKFRKNKKRNFAITLHVDVEQKD